MTTAADVVIIGGAGHVGLPLALMIARGQPIFICDADSDRLEMLRRGEYPHREAGGQVALAAVGDNLFLTNRLPDCARCRTVIIATYEVTIELVERSLSELPEVRLVVVRSTIPVGTTRALIAASAECLGRSVDVVYCPERSVEGESIREMQSLPQLVGCDSDEEFALVRSLFSYAPSLVRLTPEEAEAVKLATNAYRFAHFALANDLYLRLLGQGLDPHRVFNAAKLDYPRMAGLPTAGFVGGPCLRKDSILFMNGLRQGGTVLEAAMQINDSMPSRLVEFVQKSRSLKGATVGLLGCGFKAGTDDCRSSPAKKLAELLAVEAKLVLCTDPHVNSSDLTGLDEVIRESDVLIVVTPHKLYASLVIPPGKMIIDPWGILSPGSIGDSKSPSDNGHSAVHAMAST
jgi:UDP-N-acetyl-D-mannosaminuronic acid dehydrogenase